MKKVLLLTAALFLGISAIAAENFQVNASHRGLKIFTDKFDISILSQVICHSPDWRHNKFYTVRDRLAYENAEDGSSAAMIQQRLFDDFLLTNYRADVDGDSVIISMTCERLCELEVSAEHTIMMAPEYMLAGAKFTATLSNGKTVKGVIPAEFPGSDVHNYFHDAVKAVFTSSFGSMTVEVLEGNPFTLGDRRFTHFEGHSGFWFGYDQKLEVNVPVSSKVRISFTSSDDLVIAPIRTTEVTKPVELNKEPELVTAPAAAERRMIPMPKQLTYLDGVYELTRKSAVSIFIDDEFGAEELDRLTRAADRLLNEQDNIGIKLGGGESADIVIRVGSTLGRVDNPEGYTLEVTDAGVSITSRSPRGAFYALQTLRNLYDPQTRAFRQARIMDYPDLELRAAMFLIDDYSTVFHKNMIELMLAPLKYNHIVMECEYAKWDATEGLHQPGAISKEQIKELLEIAADNYMDVTPLFQTFGHCEWMFVDGKNLDMAEDPDFPYAYNIAHPDLYPWMDRILDEVIETFNNPKYLHIGHDEVYFFADQKFPNRPENIAKGVKEMVYEDVMHYYDYAKERDIRIMMWHDMFVTRQECPENGFGGEPFFVAELRPRLPKDIIMVDWRYAGNYKDYPDVKVFREEGFDVIGGTWYERGNIENLTKAVKKFGGMGMLQTIWNGYFGNRFVLYDGFNQVQPYVRTGAWSWNAADEANAYDAYEVAAEMWEPIKEVPAGAGFTVDLSDVANLELAGEGHPFLFGSDFNIGEILRPGLLQVGQVKFDIPAIGESAAAITLKSRRNNEAPAEVNIPLNNVKFSRLFFLHGAFIDSSLNRLNPAAMLTVTYADGSKVVKPINYYGDLLSFVEDYNHQVSPGNSLALADGAKIAYMTWENPHPNKKVKKLTLSTVPETYAYYLFGISIQK